MRQSVKIAVAVAATAAILGPLGWFWQDSLVPSTYDMAAMGVVDYGGGPATGHAHGAGGLDVSTLRGPATGTPDVAVTLTAREKDGRYTLNDTSPGPEIRAVRGQLIQVTLVNDNVAEGTTLHWHGVDVPNAEDGVAGITQDAVLPGRSHVYRFVAVDAGTYWYHSHQVSHEQVRQGLFGPLVITDPAEPPAAVDQVVTVHTYDGRRTVNGVAGVAPLAAPAGQVVRARVINTDAGPMRAWVSGAPYRIVAIDGRPVHGPADVDGRSVIVTAGGRIDMQFTVPAGGAARIEAGAGAALTIGNAPASPEPAALVDLLSYGTTAPLGFDPGRATRTFDYRIGRRPGFLDGRPGLWWSVNGKLFLDVPMYMVSTGDVVRMRISNSSGEVHPMHLHGHHAVVLSRDGAAATGSPWWFDSLDVGDGESYEVAFVADNPGIWADHCHNLQHAADGLLAHLAYTNVTTPFRVGGDAGNSPE
ncbi:multicopper oxidase family protein [Paractinoplanes rishiriensis]|uniref:Metallo-oxidoreductase n=1 Tax=Paractinoplanes rishiriensis TaxID=1050105 RepID=A0A919JTI8_9ACTN|nr:multicopper oxidase family protein [Actinoplanes rishiriensis]GIE92913.1 metallo-oxidoreductase [Actinoplanes rishiriensis]